MIKLGDQQWSVASSVFYWVVDALADRVADPTVELYLREISEENLGWVELGELDRESRLPLVTAIGELPQLARAELPASAQREAVIARPDELAHLARPYRAPQSAHRLKVIGRDAVTNYIEVAKDSGFTVIELDVRGADSAYDIILRLRDLVPFPHWCGSGWDSMNDAYEELRDAWPFPLALVLLGYDDLTRSSHALALEVALQLAGWVESFGADGARLVVALATDPDWL